MSLAGGVFNPTKKSGERGLAGLNWIAEYR
jgi:hypothetical protein